MHFGNGSPPGRADRTQVRIAEFLLAPRQIAEAMLLLQIGVELEQDEESCAANPRPPKACAASY